MLSSCTLCAVNFKASTLEGRGFDKDVLEIFNYAFMVIFTIEAILKIIAQRCDYFKDSWNLFDFVVVAGTIVILTIAWAGVGKDLEILGTILRTLRIGRVFRLIKKQ